jgi:hypothetical protein
MIKNLEGIMRGKMKPGLTCFAAILFFTGCSAIHRIDGVKLYTVSASEARTEPGKWEEFGKQISTGKAVVVRLEAGQKIPLKLTMALPMANLVPGENQLLFTRDAYLYISPTKFRISPDGQRWADIQDIKAQRKLFGFKKGDLSIGFRVTREDGPQIPVDFTAH